MSERNCAAEIVDGVVARVIVGTADWAVEHLGGQWVDTPVKVGTGWAYIDGQIVPPEPDPQDDDDLLQYNVI